MIFAEIDVAKDKHDCFLTNSDGEVLFKSFTITNNREVFETLLQKIRTVSEDINVVNRYQHKHTLALTARKLCC